MNAEQGGTPPRLVPAPPLPRLAAFALDAATYLIIPALLLPIGLLLIRHGIMLSSPAVNVIGLALVIAPATAWATWREARPRGATPGKRLLRLGVRDESTEALPSASRSLARNVIKIAVPWELGHTVALGYAYAGMQCADLVVDTDRNYLWLAARQPDLVDHSFPQAVA
jgi:uncharacterized RDD family membrane protein YckC